MPPIQRACVSTTSSHGRDLAGTIRRWPPPRAERSTAVTAPRRSQRICAIVLPHRRACMWP
jgi:hypothetical protein